jgi:hypothetical protein
MCAIGNLSIAVPVSDAALAAEIDAKVGGLVFG